MQQLQLMFDTQAERKSVFRATSKAAYDSIKENKQDMYDKITAGLIRLKTGGTFEEIAFAAKIKPEQCWKRLSEMVEKEKTVYNTGETRKTSSGRQAMVRQLVALK